jgi:acetolactate synthase-1/2/3 large subunit
MRIWSRWSKLGQILDDRKEQVLPAPPGTTRSADYPSQAEFGSDYIVEIMQALGIEYVAFNPGATFRGLHDSIVNFQGGSGIQAVECTHEEISVAIAHRYARAVAKPMAAIVHDVVGLQQATMAIFNAWIDRVPVFVIGATGPMDSTRRRPRIDWIHTANVQGLQVRDYVKLDDQPASIQAVPESMLRGWRNDARRAARPGLYLLRL